MKFGFEPKGLDHNFQQGVNLYNAGKYKEASQSFKESLKEKPQYLPTYKNLILIYLRLGQYSQIIEAMDEALKVDDKIIWIWYFKGLALKQMKNWDEALTNIEECLKLDPKDCEVLTLLGNIYRSKEDFEKAIEYYDISLEVDPFYDLARTNKLSVLKDLNRIEEIMATFEKAAENYIAKGREYENNNNPIASAIYYGEALGYMKPDSPVKENMEKVLEDINQNHQLVSDFGFVPFTLGKWDRGGLIFYDMGNIGNASLKEVGENLVKFRNQFEIPNEKLHMVSHRDKNLTVIEILNGAFKKFNLINPQPFFVLDKDQDGFAAHPPHQGSLKQIVKEFGIEQVKLHFWNDDRLTFYRLGQTKNITLEETYEYVSILKSYLKIDPERIKLFPAKDYFIAAIEKYPGAYKKFQKKTKIQPIEIRKG